VYLMTRSSSNSIATALRKAQTPATPRSDKNGKFELAKSPECMRVAHKLQRPIGQRAASNSQVELLSNYHDLAVTSETFHRQFGAQAKPARDSLYTPRRVPEKASGQPTTLTVENSAPSFRWYASVRSISTPDLRTEFAKPKQHSPDAPLKSSLKKKAKSVITQPSERPVLAARSSSEDKTIRRVKTVDFEEATRTSPVPPSPVMASTKVMYPPERQSSKSPLEANTPRPVSSRLPSCPSMMGTAKSTPADPATTRTDVHVIAIAPSQAEVHAGGDKGVDTVTPTIQFVESKNGCYEVVWDDIPVDNKSEGRGRISSANQSLRSVGSTATRGLQRVNSKLTDWSSSWNAPSDAFKPTILVFLDEDGQLPYYECAIEDQDFIVIAPPNSQKTSAAPSRLPSRPVSAPLTRAASQEDMYTREILQEVPPEVKLPWIEPLADALNVPELDLQSTRQVNTARKLRPTSSIRKLSNVEEADLKFRGHRDSVTLAHSRLMHSGDISPDLFAHRDSVSMARKRMHARNHAISAARDIPIQTAEGDVKVRPAMSLDDSVLGLPAVKEKATQALRSQKSASILGVQHPSEAQRHIRIVE
jgi:hypothetical protein